MKFSFFFSVISDNPHTVDIVIEGSNEETNDDIKVTGIISIKPI